MVASQNEVTSFFNYNFALVFHVRKTNDTIPDRIHMKLMKIFDDDLFFKMVMKIS